MPFESKVIPNLIQGVSQQSAQQRRDSQCEAQVNCLNSPKDGCLSRHGFDVLKVHSGLITQPGAFFHQIIRGDDEHYLLHVGGGVKHIGVLNLETGATWDTIPNANLIGALSGTGSARGRFAAQTIEDTTFLSNNQTVPTIQTAAPDPTTSSRSKEALFFFKAGQYAGTYAITITYAGTVYTYKYKTPDNSTAANAGYIATPQLAATFFRAMTGVTATTTPSTYGVGGVEPGDPGGSTYAGLPSVVTKPGVTLTSVGFGVEINGNLLRVYRSDDDDFEIDTADGQGDTFLTGLKDNIRAFSDLPRGGFEGMVFRVSGKADAPDATDYFVEYVNKTASSGYWQERPAMGIPYKLLPYTMPLKLTNTGINTFSFGVATWSNRICGDGVLTAKDPGFVGRPIKAMFYHKSRLGFLTEATVDWSKSRNVYTHFPDTVQTILADAPIGIEVAGQDTTSIMSKVLLADEGLTLWAQNAQFRVHSGNDTFKQDTVEVDPATSYEFSVNCNFAKAGRQVYFATESSDYAFIRSLQFQKGQITGDVDVTDHVPELIPLGARKISVSDAGRVLLVQTDGEPSKLYVYNWIISGQEIAQSAWNVWELPEGTIEWSGIYKMQVYVAMTRGTDLYVLRSPLRPTAPDPGGTYRTRLDLRVSEAQVISKTYSATTGRTTITLPYSLASADEEAAVRVALRTTSSFGIRGLLGTVVSASGATVVVEGDWSSQEFYVGLPVESSRTESRFYLRGEGGVQPVATLNIREFDCYHDRTGYYRIEVDVGAGRSTIYEMPSLSLGLAGSGAGLEPQLVTGTLTATMDADTERATIRLVNDSIYPSRWQSAEYRYEAERRAVAKGGSGK